METLDDPETWIRMDAISDRELWETRMHLKRKLVLYVMDRTRQRWMKGGYHPVQAIASRNHARSLRADHRFRSAFRHI